MSDVYQCPGCELRFASKSELEMHRSLDHPQPKDDGAPSSDDRR